MSQNPAPTDLEEDLKEDKVEYPTDEWCSPPEIAYPLADFFDGPVDIDPASNAASIILARERFDYGGLVRQWQIPSPVHWTAYLNEPYSVSGDFSAKMLAELAAERVREIVRLTMMSTSSQWWEDMCTGPQNPRILALKRLKFLVPDTGLTIKQRQRMSCRFEPALIYFGHRHLEFTRTFAHLARWATWGVS